MSTSSRSRANVALAGTVLAGCAAGLQGTAGLSVDTSGEVAFEARFDGMAPVQVEDSETYIGLPLSSVSLGMLASPRGERLSPLSGEVVAVVARVRPSAAWP